MQKKSVQSNADFEVKPTTHGEAMVTPDNSDGRQTANSCNRSDSVKKIDLYDRARNLVIKQIMQKNNVG